MRMNQYGVKLFTAEFQHNLPLCRVRADYTRKGTFAYIELFPVPRTFETLGTQIIQELQGLPIIIHAAHSKYGLDLGNKDLTALNTTLLNEARQFADALNAPHIIIHPGFYKTQVEVDEMVNQLRAFRDSRFLVENLTYSDGGTHLFYGHTPEQIALLKDAIACGFCFDLAHAVAAANALGQSHETFLTAYQALHPTMYHLCDGNIQYPHDTHDHFGAGNYPLAHFVNDIISKDALITMETGQTAPKNIQEWLDDLTYIQNLESVS